MADRLEGLDVIPVEFDETMHDLRCQQGVAERERTYARLASLVSRVSVAKVTRPSRSDSS
jgi:hypothetical protein